MQHKDGPRAEYRRQENLRIQESASIAEQFRQLKGLTVNLAFYSSEGVTKNSEIKYTVNLAHAKSLFRFDCHNHECVGGDFDLSQDLANAVAKRQAIVTGEACCQGWLSKATIDRVRCNNILRYKLSLVY